MSKIKYFLISWVLWLIILVGCKKIDHFNELPTIITGDTSNVQLSSVIITGVVTPNDAPIQTSGHVWSSTNQLPGYSANEGKTSVNGILPQNKIISNLTNLSSGKTYYIRGYVVSGIDTVYGNVVNFLTAANNPAAVSTGAVSNITLTSADIAAAVTSTGTTPVTQHGIVWSKTNQNPTTADSVLSLGSLAAPASYTSSLSNLSPATTYYSRAYVTNNAGTNYGNVVNFTTLSNTTAFVTADSIINISINSATAKGNIINIGSSAVTQYGHVWSSVNNVPTINDSKSQLGNANAAIAFNSQLTGLTANTTYYVRAYAVNTTGITYGAVLTFTTGSIANNPAVVTTGNFSVVTTSTATVAGNIIDIGSSILTQYGHVWSSVNNVPTINDSKSQLGTANAATIFNSQLTSLTPSTTYYVRAFAINNAGTSYGTVVTFTTGAVANNPAMVTTGNFSAVTTNTATVAGNITDIGSSTVTQHGHVWSSVNNVPTISDSKSQLGSANTAIIFNSQLTSLISNKTYFVRAYATNSIGTSYGTVISFSTSSQANTLPTVTTDSIVQIDYNLNPLNSADLYGTIRDTGSSNITNWGHVWSSTNTTPTINDSKSDINGHFANFLPYKFGSNPRGVLIPGTTYYVRTYAINNSGISYGNTINFRTASYILATVTTDNAVNVTFTTADIQGQITSIGNSPITEFGHVISSTNTSPSIADLKYISPGAPINGAPGNFKSYFTGLTSGTTYYIKAYAINKAGVAYSNIPTSFITTPHIPPMVSTGTITNISFTTAIASGIVQSSGNDPFVTQYGHVWSSTNNVPTINDNKSQLGAAFTGSNFTSSLTGLIAGTTYYVRAYDVNSGGIAYGNVVSFITSVNTAATVTTGDPFYQPPGVASAFVNFPGTITGTGNSPITQHGHAWSKTNGIPILSDNSNQMGAGSIGTYNSVFSLNVIPPGTYYIRAYVTNLAGTTYGAVKILTY